jgi:hypothetical protein
VYQLLLFFFFFLTPPPLLRIVKTRQKKKILFSSSSSFQESHSLFLCFKTFLFFWRRSWIPVDRPLSFHRLFLFFLKFLHVRKLLKMVGTRTMSLTTGQDLRAKSHPVEKIDEVLYTKGKQNKILQFIFQLFFIRDAESTSSVHNCTTASLSHLL